MKKSVRFTKMHGAGNDYIYVNTMQEQIPDPRAAAIVWSAPHTGIGSDGLVLIGKPTDSTDADFSMRIFNADGSEAMMCGNASRCIGKYLYEKGITTKRSIRLETLSGVKILQLHISDDGRVDSVTVDMLAPAMHNPAQYDEAAGDTLMAAGRTFRGTFVSMGNPHFVTFVDDISTLDIAHYGALLEHDKAFPERCNIEFAQPTSDGTIRTRVWERGSGITMACGTGSCASVAAAICAHLCQRDEPVTVHLDGGDLTVAVDYENYVTMTGPATFVYDGTTLD